MRGVKAYATIWPMPLTLSQGELGVYMSSVTTQPTKVVMGDSHTQNPVHIERNNGEPDEKNDRMSPKLESETIISSTAAFFLVSLAMICAVFRSSLYHLIRASRLSSGEFIARKWGIFYDFFDGNRAKMGIVLYCLSLLGHFSLGALMLFTDLTGRPKFIAKYKTQWDQSEIPADKLRRSMWTAFLNLTIYTFPVLVGLHYVIIWRGCGSTVGELPTFQTVLLELVVLSSVEEIGFYYNHRLLHHPMLYKRFHKAHHEWTAPLGIVAFHSHPLEHFLANILPVALGVIITGSHMLVAWAWLSLALASSTISHSGYHLPLLQSPEFHDYHHLKFTNNFGAFGILDWLHGTDATFRKSKQFQRHKVLLGIKSMNEVIPDDP